MGFSIGERVITKGDPILGTGRTGKVIGVTPSTWDKDLEVLAVYEVSLDDEQEPRRVVAMNLELEQPAVFEATIAEHKVRVAQDDNGTRWMVSYFGMSHACGPDFFDTKLEAMGQADPLTHLYLTKKTDCTCKEPIEWRQVEEPRDERLRRLIV